MEKKHCKHNYIKVLFGGKIVCRDCEEHLGNTDYWLG